MAPTQSARNQSRSQSPYFQGMRRKFRSNWLIELVAAIILSWVILIGLYFLGKWLLVGLFM